MSVEEFEVSVTLPFIGGKAKLKLTNAQKILAWKMYIELATRIATQELPPNRGILREALQSLYGIFDLTRQMLHEAGPSVSKTPQSFGPFAIMILNKGLRPFLAEWHPLLLDHEHKRLPHVSQVEHERSWEMYNQMHGALLKLQKEMHLYLQELAEIAGVAHELQPQND